MTYNEFIDGINSKKICKVDFSVRDYSHYKRCCIQRYDRKCIMFGKELTFDTVEVRLTNDTSELYRFYKRLKEDFKFFKIGNQTYTLKQIWDRLTITEIE